MRNLQRATGSLLTLPLLAIAAPAWGQNSETRQCYEIPAEDSSEGSNLVMRCDAIVVNGGLPQPLGNAAYSVDSVRLTEKPNTLRLENILRDIPGLQQFRRSDARTANPTSQGVTFRGLGGNASSRALLILDGVPQSDPFGGYVSWPGYDALPLGAAEIRRGGGSGSDGPGALAGTVELYSDDSGDELSGGVSYGSRDSIAADARILQNLGSGHLSIGASYQSGDGFIPTIESQRGSVDRPAAYEQAGIAVRFVAPVSDDTDLQASVRAFTDERERGFAFSENSNDGADASIRLVNRSSDGWQWSALAYLQIRSLQASFGGIDDDRNGVERVFEQFNVPSTGVGARFEVRPYLDGGFELRLGGDWRRTTGETKENFFFQNGAPLRNRFAGGQTDTLGGFVEASWQANEKLTLTGGGRLDYWSISDGFRREVDIGSTVRSDESFADRDGLEGTGRAGFAYNITNEFKLRGAAYLGWRLPTLNELFRPFRVGPDATAANENLTPERLRGAEIGVEYNSQAMTLGATVFHNRLGNAIANVTLDTGPGLFPGVGFVTGAGVYRQRQNLDDITSMGVEIDAEFRLEEIAGWDGAVLRFGYSYVDAEVDGRGDSAFLTGLRPAQVPKHNASGSFDWNSDAGFGLSLSGRYIGSAYEDDENSRLLDDAVTFDARASYDVSDNLTLETRAENILDARVETAIGSDGIIERAFPRTFWVGLRVKLD